jgi:hypothetical protein
MQAPEEGFLAAALSNGPILCPTALLWARVVAWPNLYGRLLVEASEFRTAEVSRLR